MATRTIRSRLLLALWLGPCFAATSAIDPAVDFAPDSHTRFAIRVGEAQTTDYQAVLAAYDARRVSHPDDVVSQIERCRFIEKFAYLEEAPIESAGNDLNACREQLNAGRNGETVEVLLYGVESSWAEDDLTKAKDLISKAQSWTNEQRAKLFELLAERSRWNDAEAATGYAMRAVELDPGSSVLLLAVEHWVQLGAKDKARKLLRDAPAKTWERVSRAQAAKVLLDMGDSKAAEELLRGAKDDNSDPGADLALARALTAAGDLEGARKLYRGALEREQYVALSTRIEYFEFERHHGSEADAVAAYGKLRDEGYSADSLARHRLSLLISRPGVAWQWRDALGLLTLAATALLFCVFPLIFIVPVHYRGLALRASGRAQVVGDPGWRLRDAWYAFGAILLAGYVATYVLAPSYLEAMMPWAQFMGAEPASDRVLARIMLWSTVASVVLLLPLMRGRTIKTTLCGRWSIKRSVLVGVGVALLMSTVARIVEALVPGAGMLGSDTTRSIQGAYEAYGMFGMLLLLAVLTPIAEELVFRGTMLEAFRGQVSFAFATLMQSIAFVLMHEEWQSMPYLFVFALVAGWLAKRSEGLLAPMVLHAVNNLGAGLAIVGATHLLNR